MNDLLIVIDRMKINWEIKILVGYLPDVKNICYFRKITKKNFCKYLLEF